MDEITIKIIDLIESARKKVNIQVNKIMLETYYEIGRIIVEEEQKGINKAKYGDNLIKNLSNNLIKLHGRGFSITNLKDMRKFYLEIPKSQTVSGFLGWSHITLILRIENKLKKDFYLNELKTQNWSVRELKRQINSSLFERLALSKNKYEIFKLSQTGHIIETSRDLIKDPYILEFLNLEKNSNYSEKDLEEKIINNLQKFILELGRGFMFVARQQRITLDNTNFYIDLVFYNRILKCFVLIELKTTHLKHEHLGQLSLYCNYYDREIKQFDENLTVGILLCLDKGKKLVEYTLPKENNQIFASKYQLYLPNKEELENKIEEILREN